MLNHLIIEAAARGCLYFPLKAMTVKELVLLVKEGEHTTLEFKRKVAHPEKILKEIVAFANTRGGNLLIGVNDDGRLTGLKFPDEEDYILERAIRQHCDPAIPYQKEFISLSEKKTIIRYYIPESNRKPHAILEHKDTLEKISKGKARAAGQKKAFFRVADRSIQASRELREILRRRQNPKDIRFQWGEKEQQLVKYLHEHAAITVQEFASLAAISRHQASRTLILLVLANVLDIIPAEIEDKYVIKEASA